MLSSQPLIYMILMRLFRHEMKALQGDIIVWSLVLALLSVLFLSLFPIFQNHPMDIRELLSRFPQTVRDLVGISNFNLRDLTGYYPFFLKICLELAVIAALVMGAEAVNRETQKQTNDFLFSKPVNRTAVLRTKCLSVLTATAIIGLVFIVASWVSAQIFAPGRIVFAPFFAVSAVVIFLMLLYNTWGIFIGVFFPRFRGVIAVAIGSLFAFHSLYELLQVAFGADNLYTAGLFPCPISTGKPSS